MRVTEVTKNIDISLVNITDLGGHTVEVYETNKKSEIIGHHDDRAVYLFPVETWHVLQQYCIQEHYHFPLSKSTFFKMLKDRGIIEPSNDRQPTIQKKINGKNQRVLKLISGGIYENFVTSVTDDSTN